MESTQAAPVSTVLVVDDNSANLLAMKAVLQGEHHVLCASSGEEAIAMVESRQGIDVILMDVEMPGLDGFQTAHRIHRISGYNDVPIIFVSAIYVEDPSIKRGYQVGGVDYFTKPFDADVLRLKVAAYSSLRRRSALQAERERHRREVEDLARTANELGRLLTSAAVAVLVVGQSGELVQATPALFRILGDAGGSDSFERVAAWWQTAGRAIREAALGQERDGGTGLPVRLSVADLNGTTRELLVSAAPLHASGRTERGTAVCLQDLAEARQIQAELAAKMPHASPG